MYSLAAQQYCLSSLAKTNTTCDPVNAVIRNVACYWSQALRFPSWFNQCVPSVTETTQVELSQCNYVLYCCCLGLALSKLWVTHSTAELQVHVSCQSIPSIYLTGPMGNISHENLLHPHHAVSKNLTDIWTVGHFRECLALPGLIFERWERIL